MAPFKGRPDSRIGGGPRVKKPPHVVQRFPDQLSGSVGFSLGPELPESA